MISARLLAGVAWQNACILNMSSRGLLVQAPDPPPRGSYLELRRGRHVIIARVMWSGRQRCGVRSQDPIPTELLAGDGESKPASVEQAASVERRAVQRRAYDGEQSRWRGRLLEFAVVVSVAATLAGSALMVVQEALASPIAAVEAAFRRGG